MARISPLTVAVILVIGMGAVIYPLIHLRPSPVQVNQVNQVTGSTSNVSLLVQINAKNKNKCEKSSFVINSSLAYTTLTNQYPIMTKTASTKLSSLPGSYTFTYAVPKNTLAAGYLYKIGFTIYQYRNNKVVSQVVQKYAPVNQLLTISFNCQ